MNSTLTTSSFFFHNEDEPEQEDDDDNFNDQPNSLSLLAGLIPCFAFALCFFSFYYFSKAHSSTDTDPITATPITATMRRPGQTQTTTNHQGSSSDINNRQQQRQAILNHYNSWARNAAATTAGAVDRQEQQHRQDRPSHHGAAVDQQLQQQLSWMTDYFVARLAKTTMCVTSADLVVKQQQPPPIQQIIVENDRERPTNDDDKDVNENILVDIELGFSEDTSPEFATAAAAAELSTRSYAENTMLRIPQSSASLALSATATTAEKCVVPCICAICLGSYKVKERVSWSPTNTSCLHAFHTSCIVDYAKSTAADAASKEEEILSFGHVSCPLCRRAFLSEDTSSC